MRIFRGDNGTSELSLSILCDTIGINFYVHQNESIEISTQSILKKLQDKSVYDLGQLLESKSNLEEKSNGFLSFTESEERAFYWMNNQNTVKSEKVVWHELTGDRHLLIMDFDINLAEKIEEAVYKMPYKCYVPGCTKCQNVLGHYFVLVNYFEYLGAKVKQSPEYMPLFQNAEKEKEWLVHPMDHAKHEGVNFRVIHWAESWQSVGYTDV